jgi:hypothetical protein
MLREFFTEIELAGESLAATVAYERCPFDGHPIIETVVIARGDIEHRKTLDITDMLAEWQITLFEGQIEEAAAAAIAAYKAERAEIDRRWRASA